MNTNYGGLRTNLLLRAALMNFSVKAAYGTVSFSSEIRTSVRQAMYVRVKVRFRPVRATIVAV